MPRPSTPIGRAALRVIPLSPEQVADLVARTRLGMARVSQEATDRINARRNGELAPVLRRRPKHRTSRSSCAARYARLISCSLAEAARVFGVSSVAVQHRWCNLYPDVPALVSKRGAR